MIPKISGNLSFNTNNKYLYPPQKTHGSQVYTQSQRQFSKLPANITRLYFLPINFKNRGTEPLNEIEIEKIKEIISKTNNSDSSVQHGSLGIVYKIKLPNRPEFAVKKFKSSNEARNAVKEAENLKKLPHSSNLQQFIDMFEHNGENYLVSTYKNGQSLANLKDKMPDSLIKNILNELYKIDETGNVFYDYGMGNIVYEDDKPGFFDFEISKKQSFLKKNYDAESDLCHMSRNLFFPVLTNLAGFEIRTVGKIIGELEKYKGGEEQSCAYVERYLNQLSDFFNKTSELYKESSERPDTEMSKEAVEYSQILAKIFKNPSKEIVNIEKQSIRIKELLTEYWFGNDPSLDNDAKLYSNGEEYVKNLVYRFDKLRNDISELRNKTEDKDVIKYCNVTESTMDRIRNKEVTYLSKKFGVTI